MRIHHTAICATDIEASVRFWRDGLGFTEQMDRTFEGDWPALFGARQRRLRSVFLGDPDVPDAGVVELVDFAGGVGGAPPPPPGPAAGFFLVSVYVAVEPTLARLRSMGLGGVPRRASVAGVAGEVQMAVVHDPDGVAVELVDVGEAGDAPHRPATPATGHVPHAPGGDGEESEERTERTGERRQGG